MVQDNAIPKKIVHAHLDAESRFRTDLTAGKHQYIADEPKEVDGGNDEGPDPYDFLLMSLASCTLMTVKMYANRKGWEVGNMFLELRHFKTHATDCEEVDNPPSRIDVIEKELTIEGELSQQQLDRLLDISKKCPVHRTLLSDIRIDSMIDGE